VSIGSIAQDKGFKVFDTSSSHLYLMGENHDFAKKNDLITLKLLKYLADKKNVKTFLFEMPFSQTYFYYKFKLNEVHKFNNFENILDPLLLNEEFNHIVDTYQIKVICIDVDDDYNYVLMAIKDILESISSEKGQSSEMYFGNEIFRPIRHDSYTKINERLDSMFHELLTDTSKYKMQFGGYYNYAFKILQGYNTFGKMEEQSFQFNSLREEKLREEVMKTLQDSTSRNIFGRFGLWHICKSEINKSNPLFEESFPLSFTTKLNINEITSFFILFKKNSISKQTIGINRNKADRKYWKKIDVPFIKPCEVSNFYYLCNCVDFLLISAE
jgi:hypothetical protein